MALEAPSVVGSRAELAVATGLLRRGYDVFTPFFNAHSRVDLVACDGGPALKLQVKTSRVVDGAVGFWTCSNSKGVRQDYRGQIDAFGVYSPELQARVPGAR